MAAVAGVSSPRSERTCRSSRSLAFLSSDLSSARLGLSSMASAIGTIAPKTRASHQRLVRGARNTHVEPKANAYSADCQLTHEATSRLAVEPRAPGPRLAAVSGDR